jgi:hypothetical protein
MRCSRGMAQSGSASALGAEGRRFKSCCPDQAHGVHSGKIGNSLFRRNEVPSLCPKAHGCLFRKHRLAGRTDQLCQMLVASVQYRRPRLGFAVNFDAAIAPRQSPQILSRRVSLALLNLQLLAIESR